MVVKALAFSDSLMSHATLDELRIGDGIGIDTAFFHDFQSVHGSGKVSVVAEVGKIVEQ